MTQLRRILLMCLTCVSLVFLSLHGAVAETVGVIMTYEEPFHEKAHEEFISYLTAKGYAKNLRFIIQRPHPDPIAWSNASRKLIAAEVDFIITYGAPATMSAINERSRIPIFYACVYEPIARKIKAKNAVGVCSKYSISSMLRYLKTASTGDTIGVVYNAHEDDSRHQHKQALELIKKYGLNALSLNIRNPLDTAGMLSDADIDALIITSSSLIRRALPTIMRISNIKRIPVASLLYPDDEMPMIVLTSDPKEHGRELAMKVEKFLSGSKLENISSSCTNKIELVFNVRDSRKMGFRIPMDLVTEATRIIY